MGERSQYKSALAVQDFPSKGWSHRVFGQTKGRMYQLMSDGEYLTFCNYDFSQRYYDIEEQVDLIEISKAQLIAQKAGIRYPVDPETKEPVRIIADFVLTRIVGGRMVKCVRSFKYVQDLNSSRTLEKLELERLVCQAVDIPDYGITTERQFPQPRTENLAQIYEFGNYTLQDADISLDRFRAVVTFLTTRVQKHDRPLVDITTEADNRLGNEPGTALPIAWHLIARRRWIVDIDQAIKPYKILPVIGIDLEGFIPE